MSRRPPTKAGMKKIVFLDIDGPLIPRSLRKTNTFDQKAVASLNKLFDEHEDLFAVIHSSWIRTLDWAPSFFNDRLRKLFAKQGCRFRWHDDFYTVSTAYSFDDRFERISYWLAKHKNEIVSYAIVDDAKYYTLEKAYFPLSKNNYVNVSYNDGLTEDNIEKISRILELRKEN